MCTEYEWFKLLCNNKSIQFSETLFNSFLDKGLNISVRNNLCYLEDDVQSLSETIIRSGLDQYENSLIKTLDISYVTDSTNSAICNFECDDNYVVLLAEYQSSGQGRRAKKWVSPLGSNIYLSVKFKSINNQYSHFIPLITAVLVCKALAKSGIKGCQIKWPNDIFLNGKKLAGILVESRINKNKEQEIIVGIGLNVNMAINDEIDQLWTSILNERHDNSDRNVIISTLLSMMLENFNQLEQFDLQWFHHEWSQLDSLKGKSIQVIEDNNTFEAFTLGISDDGALLIEAEINKQKVQKKLYSAEVSIRPAVNLPMKNQKD